MRFTQRWLAGAIRTSIDIGNVSAEVTGQGSFKAWIPLVEAYADECSRVVYVENVLTDRFVEFWVRRGYIRIGEATLVPSFYRRCWE